MITLKKATIKDIILFIDTARKVDKKEVLLSSGLPIELQATKILEKEPLGIWSGKELLGIGGLREDGSGGALGWMLLTEKVDNHKIEFLRWSKSYVNTLLNHYKQIYNYVYIFNFWHVEYLKWLGARFINSNIPNFVLFSLERR